MALYELIEEIVFPPVDGAEEDGLLAVGGDLSPERVLYALTLGIFPWFSQEDPILWWTPNPRFVIFPEKAKISKSMRRAKKDFESTINKDFKAVISNCAEKERGEQDGTWITDEIINSYSILNEYSYAYSFESYQNDKLVGGLYGILLDQVFIGESMFSDVSNASKVAFMHLIKFCEQNNVKIIDCQFHTPHLESLGGEYISREEYSEYLSKFVKSPFKEYEK